MSIKAPDINANYLQIRDIEIVRGDTFALNVRMLTNGAPSMLTESGRVTFAVFDRVKNTVIKKIYGSGNQTETGYINILLLPSVTATLKKLNAYEYELEWLVNSSTIYTLLQGKIKVIDEKITTTVRSDANA